MTLRGNRSHLAEAGRIMSHTSYGLAAVEKKLAAAQLCDDRPGTDVVDVVAVSGPPS